MAEILRRILCRELPPQAQLACEWLLGNGLGGYASGTIAGVLTRRYHGLLVAALPGRLGRTVMLSGLLDTVRRDGGPAYLLSPLRANDLGRAGPQGLHLHEFRLERGLPVWRFEAEGLVLEREVVLPHQQNTVFVTYRLLHAGGPMTLELVPCVHFRPHDSRVSGALPGPLALLIVESRYELIASPYPPLRVFLYGPDGHPVPFTIQAQRLQDVVYGVEHSRGYDSLGDLDCPGYFRVTLLPGREATLVASVESWEVVLALSPPMARAAERERRRRLLETARLAHPSCSGPAAELVLAADQFLIIPSGRTADAARAHATGDEVRTVIAGYHWFTDWGRDTMISLEGLTLLTGRHDEAGYILRTFAHYVRDGLIPNMFPEGEQEGLYHTADATLWFFHALDRYLQATGDRHTLRLLLPILRSIIEHHLRGTRFGIAVDPRDGLLRQGQEGYQLTWMDAKVGDWVVTPRRGKAVEINALWYNALRLLEGWLLHEEGEQAAHPLRQEADRVQRSFNERFFYPAGGYLYDLVDGEEGDDPALRPNQLLAISLRHPVLDPALWPKVLAAVTEHLLTPVGLRSLSPQHPEYKPRYDGDLRARDAAYHQGTVWAWLIGPFVDAYRRVHPEERGLADLLGGFIAHLDEACVGSISEIFDAEPPYTARGCVAQAWSVAEVLRAWILAQEG
jgi:predicted glycogen debranching enzyme